MADLLFEINRVDVEARSEIVRDGATMVVKRYLGGNQIASAPHAGDVDVDKLRKEEQQWVGAVEVLV